MILCDLKSIRIQLSLKKRTAIKISWHYINKFASYCAKSDATFDILKTMMKNTVGVQMRL